MNNLLQNFNFDATPSTQTGNSREENSFVKDSVINIPIDAGRCKVAAEIIIQHLASDPSMRILIVSDHSYHLRHLLFEAAKLNSKFKNLTISDAGDVKKQNRTVFTLSGNLKEMMRKCSKNSFDMLISIDVDSERGLSNLEVFLEKNPISKTMWITEPSKQCSLLVNSTYLAKRIEMNQISYVSFDYIHGLMHQPQKIYLKGAAPSVEAYQRAFEEIPTQHQ